MIDPQLLSVEERTRISLRSLYNSSGYSHYKMSKFEEYELYSRNKDFLVSDRIITFTDTNGRLLALKPDVTLSIIQSCDIRPGETRKYFYDENVYRVSSSTGRYTEIRQIGLECMGEVGLYEIYEVITLAARSLAMIFDSFVIEISPLDILSELLNRASLDPVFQEKALFCIQSKNAHELKRLAREYAVEEGAGEALQLLITSYGEREEVIRQLAGALPSEKLEELRMLSRMLSQCEWSDRILFDFSAASDMRYYSGYVFRGFVSGVPDRVLAGGQYDRMMKKLGKKAGAVGFAIYADSLGRLEPRKNQPAMDVVLLYDETTDIGRLITRQAQLRAQGKRVYTARCKPEELTCGEILDMRGNATC